MCFGWLLLKGILQKSQVNIKDQRSLYIWKYIYWYPSTICKRKFLYRMGPVFRASLWPDQWSHNVPLGTKWKIWTLSFYGYPVVCCRLNGVVTTTLQSQAFLQNIQNHSKNRPVSGELKTCFSVNFFQNALISKPNKILAWNQLHWATNVLNFYIKKRFYMSPAI